MKKWVKSRSKKWVKLFLSLIFLDEDGGTQKLKLKLKVKDIHNLLNGLCVLVNYDDKYQLIGEASALLAGVCG